MSTQELTTIARDLKELRLMAKKLDAEIIVLARPVKAFFIPFRLLPRRCLRGLLELLDAVNCTAMIEHPCWRKCLAFQCASGTVISG